MSPPRRPQDGSIDLNVFVGSSSEAKFTADAVSQELARAAERHDRLGALHVRPWDLAQTTQTIVSSLEAATQAFDFALFVFAADDDLLSRGQRQPTPRDNVVYELGLFTGALGSDRTYVVIPRGSAVKVLSDLAGVILYPYVPAAEDDFKALKASVRDACIEIADQMNRVLVRPDSFGGDGPPQAAQLGEPQAGAVGAEVLATPVYADLQRGLLARLSSQSDVVGRTVVHVSYGIGQVVSGPQRPDELVVVRFAAGTLSVPAAELHLTA